MKLLQKIKESQEKVANFNALLFNIPYQIELVELVGQISGLAHNPKLALLFLGCVYTCNFRINKYVKHV